MERLDGGGVAVYLVKTQRALPPPQSCCWLPAQGMLHDELLAAVAMLTVDELAQKHSGGRRKDKQWSARCARGG